MSAACDDWSTGRGDSLSRGDKGDSSRNTSRSSSNSSGNSIP